MCQMVGADVKKIDFAKENWFLEYSWTEDQQEDFKNWIIEFFTRDKKRLKGFAAFPSLAGRNKKELEKTANWFIFDYGWKVDYKKA